MKKMIYCLVLLFNIYSYGQLIEIPKGTNVEIDGVINSAEWSDAVNSELFAGEGIKLKHNDNYIFLALEGKIGGFCSIAIKSNDEIKILHLSTRLITANYKLSKNGNWKLTQEFRALPGAKRNQKVNEVDQLKEFGWYSNLVGEGPAEQSEFKISRSLFDEDLALSIVFYQVRANNKFAVALKNLNDGSINKEMVVGGVVKSLKFNPETWLKLSLK